MSNFSRNDEYRFNFDWKTVVKAFFNKYPHKDLDFVVYNKVIDLKRINEDTLIIKRVMYCKKYMVLWSYTTEEIMINLKDKKLDLQTKLLACSKAFPEITEKITYQTVPENPSMTLYTKLLESKSTFSKMYSKFSSGFEKGCKIVEEKCNEILQSVSNTQ
jgi:PRELI-like family